MWQFIPEAEDFAVFLSLLYKNDINCYFQLLGLELQEQNYMVESSLLVGR